MKRGCPWSSTLTTGTASSLVCVPAGRMRLAREASLPFVGHEAREQMQNLQIEPNEGYK